MEVTRIIFIIVLCLAVTQNIVAQSAKDVEQDKKIQILLEEIERLKSERINIEGDLDINGSTDKEESFLDKTSFNKIYRKKGNRKISIGGYGEAQYTFYSSRVRNLGNKINNPESIHYVRKEDRNNNLVDLKRLVLYFGFKLNKWIIFNTEIEVEHAKEIFVEFAYIDFLLSPYANIRTGLLLVPMGLVNSWHEPTTFLGSNRPYTERWIIPSTWRELGASFYGSVKNFSYTAALVTSFDGSQFGRTDAGLRPARQKGARALATDFSGAVQLRYQILPPLLIGSFRLSWVQAIIKE